MKEKKYLRVKPGTPVSSGDRFVREIHEAIEWVNSPDKATADYQPAVEATQKKLKDQLGLETTLLEIPDPLLLQSKWVICKESADD